MVAAFPIRATTRFFSEFFRITFTKRSPQLFSASDAGGFCDSRLQVTT